MVIIISSSIHHYSMSIIAPAICESSVFLRVVVYLWVLVFLLQEECLIMSNIFIRKGTSGPIIDPSSLRWSGATAWSLLLHVLPANIFTPTHLVLNPLPASIYFTTPVNNNSIIFIHPGCIYFSLIWIMNRINFLFFFNEGRRS